MEKTREELAASQRKARGLEHDLREKEQENRDLLADVEAKAERIEQQELKILDDDQNIARRKAHGEWA